MPRVRPAHLALAVAALAASGTADRAAAQAALVKDINTVLPPSNPQLLATVGSRVYFSVNTAATGTELGVSDGTTAGTAFVKNIYPGACSATPHFFTPTAGTTVFRANTPDEGWEIWNTDGTAAGTTLVKDINPGAGNGVNVAGNDTLVAMGGAVYFGGDDGAIGRELWKTDGTTGGTVLVKDINPNVGPPVGASNPANLASIGGTLFFGANDGTVGNELWKSDGTPAGTVLVLDINPNVGPPIGSSNPNNFRQAGATIFFTASDGTVGTELWKTDGTAAGTALVLDLRMGAMSSNPHDLVDLGGTLYFGANNGTSQDLWKSDGTAVGTVIVFPGLQSLTDLTVVGTTLYFAADDGTNGIELWSSDGTTGGTAMVKDINATAGAGSNANNLINVGGTLFFSASDGLAGNELWTSDGSPAGTVMVTDINPGPGNSNPNAFVVLGTRLVFAASDGTGAELWVSDGTAGGTFSPKRVSDTGTASSNPGTLTAVASQLYFTANNGVAGTELWKSDGSAGGTSLVMDVNPGPGQGIGSGTFTVQIVEFGGKVYFNGNDGTNGVELWATDGTAAGTAMVKDLRAGDGYGGLPLYSGSTSLYFRGNDGTNGTELWKSDGTDPGTVMVKDINPGMPSGFAAGMGSAGQQMLEVAGTLFLSATDGTTGVELWKSDGTDPGTSQVLDIRATGGSQPNNLTAVGGTLFFTADDGTVGRELWKSDGTGPGTVLVKDINPLAGASTPGQLTSLAGKLVFTANDGTNGTELWASDGTDPGTTLVMVVNTTGASNIAGFVASGGKLYFSADDGVLGNELWVTDGTPAGTLLVTDIHPTGSSNPQFLTDFDGALYFVATEGTAGYEVWKTDGTPAGTSRVTDIAAGPGPCTTREPRNLRVVGTTLYFSADDEATGLEPWKIAGTPVATCDVAVVSGAGSRPRTGGWVYTTPCPSAGGNTLDEAVKLVAPADDSDLAGQRYDTTGLDLYQEVCGTCPARIRLTKNRASGFIRFYTR